MKEKKVTIRDIARKLDVSPSTVSRALSNAPGVGEELRRKIKETARELGYIPNMAAKTLKKNRTKTVGLIIPDVTNPFFVEFVEGVDSVFFSNEYKFIVGNTDEDLEREKTYIEWFLSHGVDGIIAAPTADETGDNEKMLRKILKLDVPIVLFDRVLEGIRDRVDTVCVDNESAVKESLSHLKNMGHTEIGILISKPHIHTMKKRLGAFLSGVEELGMITKEEWILKGLFPEREAIFKIERFLGSRDLPSAVIASNQSLLRSFLRAAKSAGISIPRQISVVGFDDSIENEFYNPPITSIRQPAREMGKIAATLLLGRIEGDRSRPYRIILKTELVIRESVSDLKGGKKWERTTR